MVSGKYQNKEKPLKGQRRLRLMATVVAVKIIYNKHKIPSKCNILFDILQFPKTEEINHCRLLSTTPSDFSVSMNYVQNSMEI